MTNRNQNSFEMNCDNFELFEDYNNADCEEENINENHQEEETKFILKIVFGTGSPILIIGIVGFMLIKYPDLRSFVRIKLAQSFVKIRNVFGTQIGSASVEMSELEYQSIGSIDSYYSWPLEEIGETYDILPDRRWGGYEPREHSKDYGRDIISIERVTPECESSLELSFDKTWRPPFENSVIPSMEKSFIWTPPFHGRKLSSQSGSNDSWIPPYENVDIPVFGDSFIWTPPFHGRKLSFAESEENDSTITMARTNTDTVDMVCETPKSRPRRKVRDRISSRFNDYHLY